MKKGVLRVVVPILVVLIGGMQFAHAASTAGASLVSINAPDRVDIVYSSGQGVLFITSGSSILRYNVKTRSFLSAIDLGGSLNGIDLSPDGTTLAVADQTLLSVNLINLKTLKVTRLPLRTTGYDVGLFDVAWGSDNMVYATGALQPGWSGWVSMWRVNPTRRTAVVLSSGGITNYTLLRASSDRTEIGIAEGDISDGRWGAINVKTGLVTFRTGYTDGTAWYNYDIDVTKKGAQFALPTYGGLFIYDNDFTKVATIGEYASDVFNGVAYSPKDGDLYAAQAHSDAILVFNPKTFTVVRTLHTGVTFASNGNWPFLPGTLRFSADGTLLFVWTPNGIGYLKLTN